MSGKFIIAILLVFFYSCFKSQKYCNLKYSFSSKHLLSDNYIELKVRNQTGKSIEIADDFDGYLALKVVNVERYDSINNKFTRYKYNSSFGDCFSCKNNYITLKPKQTIIYNIYSDKIEPLIRDNHLLKFRLFFEIYHLTKSKCNNPYFLSPLIFNK